MESQTKTDPEKTLTDEWCKCGHLKSLHERHEWSGQEVHYIGEGKCRSDEHGGDPCVCPSFEHDGYAYLEDYQYESFRGVPYLADAAIRVDKQKQNATLHDLCAYLLRLQRFADKGQLWDAEYGFLMTDVPTERLRLIEDMLAFVNEQINQNQANFPLARLRD